MRFEIKYIVHNSKLDKLREMIAPFVNLDKHLQGREIESYTVRSVYFDTPDLLFYREKIEGVPYRLKLRMRTYDDPQAKAPMFFEIKRKHQVPMTKNRAFFEYDTALNILSDGLNDDQLENLNSKKLADCQRFLYHLHHDNLCPTVLVVYDREAYESILDNTVRVTFDKHLRSADCSEVPEIYRDDLAPVMEDHFILEVKYNKSYPHWLELIVNSLDLKQQAASKYCMCMDNHPSVFQRDHWAQLISFRNSITKRA